MWDSPEALSTFGAASVYIALGSALIAAFAGAAGTIASNRASNIQSRQSNERIALADARAAEARLETERLKGALADRHLSAEQSAILAKDLATLPHGLWISHDRQNPEAAAFHAEIFAAFEAAGIKPKWFGGINSRVVGILVTGKDTRAKRHLIGALRKANLSFEVEGEDPKFFDGKLGLVIGSRPGF